MKVQLAFASGRQPRILFLLLILFSFTCTGGTGFFVELPLLSGRAFNEFTFAFEDRAAYTINRESATAGPTQATEDWL